MPKIAPKTIQKKDAQAQRRPLQQLSEKGDNRGAYLQVRKITRTVQQLHASGTTNATNVQTVKDARICTQIVQSEVYSVNNVPSLALFELSSSSQPPQLIRPPPHEQTGQITENQLLRSLSHFRLTSPPVTTITSTAPQDNPFKSLSPAASQQLPSLNQTSSLQDWPPHQIPIALLHLSAGTFLRVTL